MAYEQAAPAEWNARRARAHAAHKTLWRVCKKDPLDYAPYGDNRDRAEDGESDKYQGDCSSGCRYFIRLGGELGSNWGVCANPASHRYSLLTFEHQGCPQFVRATGSAELIARRDEAPLPPDTRAMLFDRRGL
jgi:hypothetical protein